MKMRYIIIIVIISIFISGLCLYTGLLNEAALFGYNTLIGLINTDSPQITLDNNIKTVKKGAFAYRLLDYINIPDSVTTIEKDALKGNKLTSVIIPSNVTLIGEKAFSINKLTSITIGSNVTLEKDAIGFGFEDAYKRNGMDAGTYMRRDAKSMLWTTWYNNFRYEKYSGNITIVGYNGYDADIVIPEEINGYPVKIIGEKAFYEKKINNVIIPDSVTIIKDMAFYGAWDRAKKVPKGTISGVTIGKNVSTIGDHVFENNSISKIIFPDSVTSIGICVLADNPITSVSIGANVKLGDKDSYGILGENTGFNTAYTNNNKRAGVYTRPNTKTTTWTRASR